MLDLLLHLGVTLEHPGIHLQALGIQKEFWALNIADHIMKHYVPVSHASSFAGWIGKHTLPVDGAVGLEQDLGELALVDAMLVFGVLPQLDQLLRTY